VSDDEQRTPEPELPNGDSDEFEYEERREFSADELREILEKHRTWVDSEGREGTLADLSETILIEEDLTGADLRGAKLSKADFHDVDLTGADLCSADLSEATFAGSNLSDANLCGANLREAVFYGTRMHRTNFSGANFSGADLAQPQLVSTDFSEANFNGADFTGEDLRGATFSRADLSGVDLIDANLSEVILTEANLSGANLCRADLSKANLEMATLEDADLCETDLSEANLSSAQLDHAHLREAQLRNAILPYASLCDADLSEANFSEADLESAHLDNANLWRTDLSKANLSWASLRGARLDATILVEADLTYADMQETALLRCDFSKATLDGAKVYGVAAWDLDLTGCTQRDLCITPTGEPAMMRGLFVGSFEQPAITVDSLEVAQFIYLLLHNEKIRDIIDTITSKVVLILGRFSEDRKRVLDAIRAKLRHRNLIPVMFDFHLPDSKDLTGTVETLARMARYVVADLTDPSSIPHEMATLIPHLRTTPVLPLRLKGTSGYGMFADMRAYNWVLDTYEYEDSERLIEQLDDVLAPVEEKVSELRGG